MASLSLRPLLFGAIFAITALLRPTPAVCGQAVANFEKFTDDFTYRVESIRPDDPLRITFITHLALKLEASGIHPLLIGPQPNRLAPALSLIDALFASDSLRSSVFLKLGVAPSRPGIAGKILEIDQDYLYHGETPGGMPYAIYFTGIPREKIPELIGEIEVAAAEREPQDTRGRAWAENLTALFIKPAMADDEPDCDSPTPVASSLKAVAASSQAIFMKTSGNTYLQNFLHCISGLGSGIADGTPITSMISIVGQFKNPGQAWKDIKNSAVGIYNFFFHMDQECKKMVQDWETLSPTAKWEFGCRVAGFLGAAIYSSLTSFGVLTPIEETAFANAVTKALAEPKFASFMKPVKVFGHASGLTDQVKGVLTSAKAASKSHLVVGVGEANGLKNTTSAYINQTAPQVRPVDERVSITWESAKPVLVDALCDISHGSRAIAQVVDPKSLKCPPAPPGLSRSISEFKGMTALNGIQWNAADPKTRPSSPEDDALQMKAANTLAWILENTRKEEDMPAEMHTLIRFIHVNSNNYGNGVLAKQGSQLLLKLYETPDLPDNIRKMAYTELINGPEATLGKFKSDADIRKELGSPDPAAGK